MMSLTSMGSNGRPSTDDKEEHEASKTAIATYQEREEEIERRKMEVKERVESQLTRAEEETRRLAQVWEELEVLTDPMRKEVATVRKRIDLANRDLKSIGQICQKKEKEYKEAMEAFQEKNNEKSQLTTALIELVNQSEKFRMRKLEELSKIVNSNT
ncbi:hypothetical protein ABFS82_06G157800 [Erythranthe guttata]|uniref:Uncharacterized protein n=1 Tax=Erythranthe guttata TaxID=4155 RepID=A0A022REA7_ERYGU|nr:PREDICTED: reticulocyte-binding protein 2 homolog a-like [Erythranthe guttata]EYU38078.1 hypothetical protein MIMGU_mgv1a015496mg [Erythranthe guttata]|eukprot:XP_012836709.1 PREDICTED: reticulocyte-binding protein 2 homolog a-like [Erythranthe guttata]